MLFEEDIPDVPETCPVLRIPLEVNSSDGRGPSDNSPTIDRIIPAEGYVAGNIRWISNRANRFKNDATPEESLLVAIDGLRLQGRITLAILIEELDRFDRGRPRLQVQA